MPTIFLLKIYRNHLFCIKIVELSPKQLNLFVKWKCINSLLKRCSNFYSVILCSKLLNMENICVFKVFSFCQVIIIPAKFNNLSYPNI